MTSFNYRLNPLYPIKECSSCGALYTTDYCCSIEILGDKIICDLDKTPDLSQQSPQNYPKCGHPVNGHYCQGCALLRKKFKEDLFTSGIEHGILQDSSESSNDNLNVVNAPREPFVVNQDPGKNSSQSPPQINHHCCYGCGDPLKGIFCHQCTCELCGNGAHYGYNCPPKVSIIPDPEPFNNQTIKNLPPTVQSFDPKYDLVYNSSNIFDPPPQLPFYSCEFCGNDARYGHYCTPQSFSDEDVPKKIYSNPLFDDEIISKKIDPHHFNAESDLIDSLLNHDSSIISSSSKIDSLFDEFAGELTFLKSIPPGIDETDYDPEVEIRLIEKLLYDNSSPRPPEEFVSGNSDTEIESFSPSPILVKDSDSLMKEIDLSFTSDYPMPPGIEDDDYDSERDVLILDELLSNNSLSLPENESFHFDIPSFSRPPAKPPDGNTGILNVKIMGDIFEQKVPMPRLMITRVSNQEKSPDLLSHLGHEAFQPSAECPMMIHGRNTPILDVPMFHFYPP
uniref:Pre-mRNA splicing Prp18-interacting factor n=1 Tax=Tanacetum cinerariifolium TaxID=118510 RepID=A0A6L2KD09_TANCI|nr:hypothetical protein [Tanacetum cinerariifolium]